MTKPKVRTIDQLAGSYLHSSRIDPGHCHAQEAPPFLRVSADDEQHLDLTNHIKRAITHLQLDALIVVGAGTSLKYGARLSQEGIPVIGIPKSVHNDISGTTYSLGFSSALRRGVGFVNEVRDIAASREEIAVVTVLGHDSGLSTMLIASFANADRTLIPEVPFNPGRLAELLIEDKRRNPSNYAILVMSDGSRLDPTTAPEEIAKLSADIVVAGQRGSGAMTTRVLEDFIGEHILYQPLSYLIRTGDADGWDLIAATNFGIMAVDLIANNKSGRLVSYRLEDGYIDVPLEEATHPTSVDMARFYDSSQYAPKSTIFTVAARRTLGV